MLPSSFKKQTEAFQKPSQVHNKMSVPQESSFSKQKKEGYEESVKKKTNSKDVSSLNKSQTLPTSHVLPSSQDKLPVSKLNKASSKEHFQESQQRRPKQIVSID